MSEKKPITTEQLAEFLDLPTNSIRRLCREKKIPHIRIGRLIRFDVDEVIKQLTVNINNPGDE